MSHLYRSYMQQSADLPPFMPNSQSANRTNSPPQILSRTCSFDFPEQSVGNRSVLGNFNESHSSDALSGGDGTPFFSATVDRTDKYFEEKTREPQMLRKQLIERQEEFKRSNVEVTALRDNLKRLKEAFAEELLRTRTELSVSHEKEVYSYKQQLAEEKALSAKLSARIAELEDVLGRSQSSGENCATHQVPTSLQPASQNLGIISNCVQLNKVDAVQSSSELATLAASFQELLKVQQGSLYVTTASQIKEFDGTGGATAAHNYIDRFNIATNGWPEDVKLTTLKSKLSGRALRIFKALPKETQKNFAETAKALQEKLNDFTSTGMHAFNQMMFREPRNQNEDIEKFAAEVEKTVRSAFSVDTPQAVLDDMCRMTFLAYINDDFLSAALAVQTGLSFHELVNKAISMKESREAIAQVSSRNHSSAQSIPNSRQNQVVEPSSQTSRQTCTYCGFPGHVFEDCRNRQRDERREKTPPVQTENGDRFSRNSGGESLRYPHRQNQQFQDRRPPHRVPRLNAAVKSEDSSAQERSSSPVDQNVSSIVDQNVTCLSDSRRDNTARSQSGSSFLVGTATAQVAAVQIVPGDLCVVDSESPVLDGCRQNCTDVVHPPLSNSGTLPVVPIQIYGVQLQSLLDSGAEVSLISSDTLRCISTESSRNLKVEGLHRPTVATISSVDGAKLKAIHAITLPITDAVKTHRVELQVVETALSEDLILGANALGAFGYMLCSSNRCFQFDFKQKHHVIRSAVPAADVHERPKVQSLGATAFQDEKSPSIHKMSSRVNFGSAGACASSASPNLVEKPLIADYGAIVAKTSLPQPILKRCSLASMRSQQAREQPKRSVRVFINTSWREKRYEYPFYPTISNLSWRDVGLKCNPPNNH